MYFSMVANYNICSDTNYKHFGQNVATKWLIEEFIGRKTNLNFLENPIIKPYLTEYGYLERELKQRSKYWLMLIKNVIFCKLHKI